MPFPVPSPSPPPAFAYRYAKGLLSDYDPGNGSIIRAPADSDGKIHLGNRDLRLVAFKDGSDVGLFKVSRRLTSLPPGWSYLNVTLYKAEFQALLGRQPTSKEL